MRIQSQRPSQSPTAPSTQQQSSPAQSQPESSSGDATRDEANETQSQQGNAAAQQNVAPQSNAPTSTSSASSEQAPAAASSTPLLDAAGGGSEQEQAAPGSEQGGGGQATANPSGGGGGGGDGADAGGGSAPSGGGGGGGGGGGSGGAPSATQPGGEIDAKDEKELINGYSGSTSSDKARNFPELTPKLDELSKESSETASEAVPEFHATLQDNMPLDGDAAKAQVDATKSNAVVDDGKTGNVEDPEIKETEDYGTFEGNRDPGQGVSRLGSKASKDAKKSATMGSIDNLQDADNIDTSAGAPPKTPIAGDTDDQARTGQTRESSTSEASEGLHEANHAIVDSPGQELVQEENFDEIVPNKEIEKPELAEPTEVVGMEQYKDNLKINPEVEPAFNELTAAEFEASTQQANQEISTAVDTRNTDTEQQIEEADQKANTMTQAAQAEQDETVEESRKKIQDERDTATAKQREETQKASKKLADEQSVKTKDAQRKRSEAESKVESEYKKGESKADREVKKGKEKAKREKKKKEKEAENQSWWDKAVSAITDLVSAIADAISAVFDAVRSAVSAILDAVKSLANAIIDAACKAICALIDAYAAFAKTLIQGLLGAVFPEIADALCAAVDAVATYAKEKVTQLADKLKEGIAALCDAVNAAINAIISVYEAAVQTALGVLQAVLTGDWTAVLLKVLESALKLCGISPDDFYALIGKVQATIETIVNDPGAFLSHCIDAVAKGFGQFADNFLTHLQNGFVEWLTGQAGDTGIQMPDALDLQGVFSIVLQVMGLTQEKIREKAVEHLGEENVARIEFVWGFIEAAIEGGLEGLWEHIQGHLDSLWDDVIGAIQEWIMQKIIVKAVTKLATMFNPVGAIVQALLTAWDLYCFIRDEIQRIFGVVKSVVDSIHDIAMGNIGNAANMVEQALADLVPVAISLLANLLGLGGIGKKVASIVEAIQNKVWEGIDKLIEKVKGMFKGGDGDGKDGEQAEDPDNPDAGGVVPPIQFQDDQGESHKVYYTDGPDPVMMVASDPKPAEDQAKEQGEFAGADENQVKSAQVKGQQTLKDARKDTKDGDKDKAKAGTDAAKKAAEDVKALVLVGPGEWDPNVHDPFQHSSYKAFEGACLSLNPPISKAEAEAMWKLILESIGLNYNADAKTKPDEKAEASLMRQEARANFATVAQEMMGPKRFKKFDDKPYMLWSGGNITRLFGQAQGFTALETTDAGHVFNHADLLTRTGKVTWKQVAPLWEEVSRQFAMMPEIGEIHTFQRKAGDIFKYVELPTLVGRAKESGCLDKLSFKYHAVGALGKVADEKVNKAFARVSEPKVLQSDLFEIGLYDSQSAALGAIAQHEENVKAQWQGREPDDVSGDVDGPMSAADIAKAIPPTDYTDERTGEHHEIRIHVSSNSAEVREHSPGPGKPLSGFDLADKVDAATEELLKPGVTAKRKKELRENIKKWMKMLPEAMARARGDNLPTQKEREKLEQQIGKRSVKHKPALKTVQDMCTNALRMMVAFTDTSLKEIGDVDAKMADLEKFAASNEDFQKVLSDRGTPLKIGYVGAVGKNYKDVLAVFKGGNLYEQMCHLVQFGKYMGEKIMDTHGNALRARLKTVLSDKDQIEQIMLARKAGKAGFEELKAKDPKKAKKKAERFLLLDTKEISSIGADGEEHTRETHTPGYEGSEGSGAGKAASGKRDAKGRFMKQRYLDRKIPMEELPRMTVDQLKTICRAMGLPVGGVKQELIDRISDKQVEKDADNPGTTGIGDSNPRGRPGADEAGDRHVPLSEREKKDISDRLEGWTVNIVNEEHEWAVQARDELAMPLKSGISGTTYRMMHMADLLGVDNENARVALFGYLIPLNMHSYHEIAAAAKAYVPYTPGTYYPLAPWELDDVKQMCDDAQIPESKQKVIIHGGKLDG